jgi:hypothetical protein
MHLDVHARDETRRDEVAGVWRLHVVLLVYVTEWRTELDPPPKFSLRKGKHLDIAYLGNSLHQQPLLPTTIYNHILEEQNGLGILSRHQQPLDQHVRQAQPLSRPLANTRRCAIQIPRALSNTSRSLTLSLAQQRPSTRQWHTRQPQSHTLTQRFAPSLRPPNEPRPPTTAQRKNRNRKTHKERQ